MIMIIGNKMTTVYISRHSIPFNEHRGIENYVEDKLALSVN